MNKSSDKNRENVLAEENDMESRQTLALETATPTVRWELRARIVRAGYRYYSRFAEKIGIDKARLSRILGGHEYPSKRVQRVICDELNLTLAELKRLL
jgi:hypothetical protein